MNSEEGFFSDPRSWVAIAFVIFFLLAGRKIWSVLTAMLDKRAAMIRADLAEAQRLREDAEAMLHDASSRRETAIADAERLLSGAKTEAARLADLAAKDAENAATRRERMAMDRIAAAEKQAVDDVRYAAAEIATAVAERVIRGTFSAESDAGLIDHAIATLPAALAAKRAA